MKLTDGNRTVEIYIYEWGQPDWANAFFESGRLPYDEDSETYKVEDVLRCLSQAADWRHSVGDFDTYYDPDSAPSPDGLCVDVELLSGPEIPAELMRRLEY